ncbi:MAG TPA: DUF389 domain-containing protein, partial [Anaerolineae bacterium]|nr:DUF389 domain-containing protein [Anaerolineae bacterium]
MKIIHGNIPSAQKWRVMVLLAPTNGVTLAWQIGRMLAQANHGSVLAAVIVEDDGEVAAAQQTLAEIGRTCSENTAHDLLILKPTANPSKALKKFIAAARVDLLIADTDAPLWQYLDKLPCTVATLRGSRDRNASVLTQGIHNILMPTSGGPHSVHALQFLVQLPQTITLEALYVGRTSQGQHEKALGQARLDQMFEIADCGTRVQSKVVLAEHPIQGIVEQASQGHDLVVLGASQETSLDKALFGDVVTSVVRESKVPVLVVKQPQRLAADLADALDWRLQRIFPRLTPERRRDVYVKIRENAQPDLDYFVLITLASLIAALGLVLNSSATIIGAMLVAPLMSPIVATGLAMILGDGRFLRFAFGTAVRGVLIAIAAGVVIGLMPGNSLSAAVLVRTAPTLIDLAVAFFSGLAGAFALSYWEAEGALPGVAIAASLVPPLASSGIALAEGEWRLGLGALILFITNYLMIALAAALVFLVFGF